MYRYKKDLNIVGNEFVYYVIQKRKKFLFVPYWSGKIFKDTGKGKTCYAKTKKEAEDLIKILN